MLTCPVLSIGEQDAVQLGLDLQQLFKGCQRVLIDLGIDILHHRSLHSAECSPASCSHVAACVA